MLCLIHSFLVSTSSFRSVGMSLSFYPASCENGRKLEREKLRLAECGILRRLKSEVRDQSALGQRDERKRQNVQHSTSNADQKAESGRRVGESFQQTVRAASQIRITDEQQRRTI